MAEDKTKGQPGDEIGYDLEDASPADHDPQVDDQFLRDSEEFFQKNNPAFAALLKRVRIGSTKPKESGDGK